METRPKIKIALTPFDKALEWASAVLLVVVWSIMLYMFPKMPGVVPIHFSAAGKVDGYGNKTILLFLPILCTLLYVGLSWLNKYPHVFNYLPAITAANAVKQYTIATRMLRFVKLSILIVFTVVILFIHLATKGVTHSPGIWFLPLTFALLLVPVAISVSQSLKAK